MKTTDDTSRKHPLRFGDNTNGFAHHTLEDALHIISEIGYDGVALTLDVHHLNPFTATQSRVRTLGRLLRRLKLDVVVETGARYLLDPRHKHEPSFVSASGSRKRVAFAKAAVDIAALLGAPVVTVHSGVLSPGTRPKVAERRLASGLRSVCRHAGERGVVIGLEPEPGMYVETVADYYKVKKKVAHPSLMLTLDVGHLFCTECDNPVDIIAHLADDIANVHIEDIKDGRHFHLPPGEGDIDFAPVLNAFRTIDYSGLVAVELSRNSHNAPEAAREAIKYLRQKG